MKMEFEYKACPLLVQSETIPSLTIENEIYTRTYFSRCLIEKCAAYQTGLCMKFNTNVILPKNEKEII